MPLRIVGDPATIGSIKVAANNPSFPLDLTWNDGVVGVQPPISGDDRLQFYRWVPNATRTRFSRVDNLDILRLPQPAISIGTRRFGGVGLADNHIIVANQQAGIGWTAIAISTLFAIATLLIPIFSATIVAVSGLSIYAALGIWGSITANLWYISVIATIVAKAIITTPALTAVLAASYVASRGLTYDVYQYSISGNRISTTGPLSGYRIPDRNPIISAASDTATRWYYTASGTSPASSVDNALLATSAASGHFKTLQSAIDDYNSAIASGEQTRITEAERVLKDDFASQMQTLANAYQNNLATIAVSISGTSVSTAFSLSNPDYLQLLKHRDTWIALTASPSNIRTNTAGQITHSDIAFTLSEIDTDSGRTTAIVNADAIDELGLSLTSRMCSDGEHVYFSIPSNSYAGTDAAAAAAAQRVALKYITLVPDTIAGLGTTANLLVASRPEPYTGRPLPYNQSITLTASAVNPPTGAVVRAQVQTASGWQTLGDNPIVIDPPHPGETRNYRAAVWASAADLANAVAPPVTSSVIPVTWQSAPATVSLVAQDAAGNTDTEPEAGDTIYLLPTLTNPPAGGVWYRYQVRLSPTASFTTIGGTTSPLRFEPPAAHNRLVSAFRRFRVRVYPSETSPEEDRIAESSEVIISWGAAAAPILSIRSEPNWQYITTVAAPTSIELRTTSINAPADASYQYLVADSDSAADIANALALTRRTLDAGLTHTPSAQSVAGSRAYIVRMHSSTLAVPGYIQASVVVEWRARDTAIPPPPGISLTADPQSAAAGQNIVLTATVSNPPAFWRVHWQYTATLAGEWQDLLGARVLTTDLTQTIVGEGLAHLQRKYRVRLFVGAGKTTADEPDDTAEVTVQWGAAPVAPPPPDTVTPTAVLTASDYSPLPSESITLTCVLHNAVATGYWFQLAPSGQTAAGFAYQAGNSVVIGAPFTSQVVQYQCAVRYEGGTVVSEPITVRWATPPPERPTIVTGQTSFDIYWATVDTLADPYDRSDRDWYANPWFRRLPAHASQDLRLPYNWTPPPLAGNYSLPSLPPYSINEFDGRRPPIVFTEGGGEEWKPTQTLVLIAMCRAGEDLVEDRSDRVRLTYAGHISRTERHPNLQRVQWRQPIAANPSVALQPPPMPEDGGDTVWTFNVTYGGITKTATLTWYAERPLHWAAREPDKQIAGSQTVRYELVGAVGGTPPYQYRILPNIPCPGLVHTAAGDGPTAGLIAGTTDPDWNGGWVYMLRCEDSVGAVIWQDFIIHQS